MVQLVYIPQVMNQREADHMDEVANQFSFLKAIVDLQSMTQKDIPISSPITLGGRELPYFISFKAEGEVNIIDDAGEIQVDYATICPLTSIRYTAYNRYYPELKAYTIFYELEGGIIIVKQPDGEPVSRVDPSITVENGTTIDIYYEIPIIIGVPGKIGSGQSYKTCFVRTNYSDSSDANWISLTDVSNITVFTSYPSAWNESFSNIENLGTNVNITKKSTYVSITPKSKEINLHYKRIYIYAQISPGWIK
ncbi:MAG: hypothetical protein A3K77_06810 [Euryarchaeota archaeon RBG_13_31_8]|nr:MAG: hypothetical protein A3K77_06810 [Euryarchaeota archaeon RBG_13_31_8]